jgi:thiol:disulfide interchange protein
MTSEVIISIKWRIQMNKKIIFLLLLSLISTIASASTTSLYDITNPALIMQYINTHSVIIYLFTFFIMGILLSFTPCVLPMVPILSGIIVGQKQTTSKKAFLLSLSYVFGMAITYALAGMAAGYLGSTIQTLMQKPIILIAFSMIFIAMGLSMIGIYDIKMPQAISNRLSVSNTKQNYLAVAFMGVLSTLIASPCVTAPLIGVLTFIGQSGKAALGGLILFIMALGMGLPLLLVGAGFGKFLPNSGLWMMKIKSVFGFMMFAIALYLLSRLLPTTLSVIVASLLIVAFVDTMFDFKYKTIIASAIGIAITATYFDLNRMPQHQANNANFTTIHTLGKLQEQLVDAKINHKPVFVEFFASWCSDCQAMDSVVFNNKSVIDLMKPYQRVKVDISDNSKEVQEIKRVYGIFGTPTMIFFKSNGYKQDKLTSVGFTNVAKLNQLLKQGLSD